jgi:TolB-like protein/Tfp pilus assembly protein PilF
VTFFDELKRRNVLRVAAAYVVTAWLAIQVAETILPQYGLEHHVRTAITVLAIGFIPAMILAWALEWTPQGIRLDAGVGMEGESAATARSSRKFDRIVIVILAVALAWFIYDKMMPPAPDVQYSIAVLPFSNESPDALPDYLADGLAGEVRNLLAKLPQLLVIERSSAFSFKGQEVAFPEIGTRLGVSHLLTGEVTQFGNGIRVRARLLDATAGESLWSKAFTGTLNDIFAIQDEIASDVIRGLELETQSSLPESRRTTPEVLALTLQAKQLWNNDMGEKKGKEMAALLEEAIDIDPYYTPAMVWMVYANWQLRTEGVISSEEENERWLKLAGRILAIEPDNGSVHNLFGWEALYMDHDLEAAALSYARALKSEPNDAEILRTVARFAMLIGRMEDGLAMIDRSMAIDPLCGMCLYGASKYYMYAGRFQKAEELRQRFVTLHDQGHFEYGIMKLLNGKAMEALEIFQELRMVKIDSVNDGRTCVGLAMAFHDLGRSAESDEQLALLIEDFGEQNQEGVAKVYAWRNEKDAAFEWLNRARDYPDFTMILLDPAYKNLHDDPRWASLSESLGFSEEILAKLKYPVELFARYHD